MGPSLAPFPDPLVRADVDLPMTGAVNSGAALVGDTLFVGSGDSESGAGGGVHSLRPM